ALLGVGGVVLASFPHYIAGFLDQPAGFAHDDGDLLPLLNLLVLGGHALMALTVFAFVGLLIKLVFAGDDSGTVADDPFDAHTIEWATTSPAPTENFVDVPMITSAEPLLDRKEANAEGSAS
ncbi:MAG: hypothetical protein AAGG08_08680, partial [Actinomycetota bacterium]